MKKLRRFIIRSLSTNSKEVVKRANEMEEPHYADHTISDQCAQTLDGFWTCSRPHGHRGLHESRLMWTEDYLCQLGEVRVGARWDETFATAYKL